MTELKRTPLFEVYKEYGGKTVDFGGWELPVQTCKTAEGWGAPQQLGVTPAPCRSRTVWGARC